MGQRRKGEKVKESERATDVGTTNIVLEPLFLLIGDRKARGIRSGTEEEKVRK